MVYDNNFTIAPQGPTPPPGYQMAHGGHAFGAYLLWLGLISLLFTWGWGAIRSLFYFGGTPSAPSAETPEHELTKQERKQRLLQYFEDGRQRMVRESIDFGRRTSNHPAENSSDFMPPFAFCCSLLDIHRYSLRNRFLKNVPRMLWQRKTTRRKERATKVPPTTMTLKVPNGI